jgi:hypothetical protein
LIPKIRLIYGSVLTNQNWNQQFLHLLIQSYTLTLYIYDLDAESAMSLKSRQDKSPAAFLFSFLPSCPI